MRRSFRFLAILACALPLACSDTSTTPTATAPPVPRLSANPESSGSFVTRTDGESLFWWWYDVDKQLIAVQGNFDWVKIACEGTWVANALYGQYVLSRRYPPDEVLAHYLGKDPEAFVHVFSGTPETANFCQPTASGTGRLVVTNSDVIGEQVDRPQAHSWGVSVEGQLTGADGGLYHYNSQYREIHTGPSDNWLGHVTINFEPIGR